MINFRGKTRFLSAVILVIGLFFVVRNVQAATSTVRGAAWWGDEYQYLYFDCLDDIIGDQLGVAGNLYAPPIPYGFHFYATPCTSIIHHVSLDDNGSFSGQAWNYSEGLVTFDATTTPPDSYSFNSHCPTTCDLSNNCLACYNETDQKVYGWARVLSDGAWIKLDSATTTPVQIKSWNAASSTSPWYENLAPGDFIGYATSSIGDLSFNCQSEGGGTCATRDYYKVYVKSLRIGHLSAPNWSYTQACTSSATRQAVLKWYLKSGTQTAYRLIFNTNNSTSSPVFDSGKISGSAVQYICPGPLCA